MKRAPNPTFYFDLQAERLFNKDPQLFVEIQDFIFERWSGGSIAYQRRLSDALMKCLSNPYGYANSTFIRSIRAAIHRLLRKRRREIGEARKSGRKEVRQKSEAAVECRGDKTSNARPVRHSRKK